MRSPTCPWRAEWDRSTSRPPQRLRCTKPADRNGRVLMSDIDVRAIRDDELADYLRCLGIAFHFGSQVTESRLAFSRERFDDLSRRLGAFVAGSLCGTAASFGTHLTVPGERTVPCAAVTQVTVLPTHRRRGLLASMMRTQLLDAVER